MTVQGFAQLGWSRVMHPKSATCPKKEFYQTFDMTEVGSCFGVSLGKDGRRTPHERSVGLFESKVHLGGIRTLSGGCLKGTIRQYGRAERGIEGGGDLGSWLE